MAERKWLIGKNPAWVSILKGIFAEVASVYTFPNHKINQEMIILSVLHPAMEQKSVGVKMGCGVFFVQNIESIVRTGFLK